MNVLKSTKLNNSTDKSAVFLKDGKSSSDPGKTHDHGIPMIVVITPYKDLGISS